MSEAGSDPGVHAGAASSSVRPRSQPPEEPPASDDSRAQHVTPSVPPPVGARETFQEACGLALAACLLGSVPAALRIARAGGSFIGGLLAAAAIVMPLVAIAMSLSRPAGRGFRMVTGLRAGRSTAAVLALWVGLMAPVFLVLGAVLKEKTNHRGLGGTTFGVVSLVVAIGTAAVAHRLVQTGRWLVDRGQRPRVVASALAVLAVLPLLVVSVPLLRAHDESEAASHVAAALIDGVLFAVAGAVAVTYDIGERPRTLARKYGAFAAGGVLVLGLFWFTLSPTLAASVRTGGGLASALVGSLEKWTDRDGDGHGAHFGGRDCDEGDPRVFPGAADPAGDGLDQDCDGVDGVAGGPTPPRERDSKVAEPDITKEEPKDPPPAPVAATKPSIIVVTLDTVRADRTSAYGYKERTTPRLEALAARGALFENAYAPASDTQRALMPLFSGQSYRDTPRTNREWPTLRDEANTVAERMKAAGYRTVAVSSFQWISEERGFQQGFDELVPVYKEEHPEKGVTGPLAIRSARAAIEKSKTDPRPLYLWVHLFDAHEQYKRHQGFEFGRGERGAYDSEIAFTDKQLGDLIDAVDASPMKDTTVWIVHGSQGEGFDEHDVKGHGRELYEEMVRVPLVVALPGADGAKKLSGRAVSTSDIVPTVLELAGVGGESVGTSLLGPARSGTLSPPGGAREPILLRNAKRASVIDYPLKLIVIDREKRDRILLFDLSSDPNEERDLSSERAADVTRLKALIDADRAKDKRE